MAAICAVTAGGASRRPNRSSASRPRRPFFRRQEPPTSRSGTGDAEAAITAFIGDYRAYFRRHNERVGGIKKPLDPLPRVLAIPGFGIVGIGKTAVEASISSDVAEAWIDAVLDAESVGTFESITEAEHFDMEYWSLEQAKLGKGSEKRLARQIVAVTGGGGAIGNAIARAFAAEGAEVAILDLDADKAEATRKMIGGRSLAVGLRRDRSGRCRPRHGCDRRAVRRPRHSRVECRFSLGRHDGGYAGRRVEG